MGQILLLFVFLLPTAAPKGSHSLWMLATYIKGQTAFPEFSYVVMLDDVSVLYFNGDTNSLIARGNTKADDEVFNLNALPIIHDHIQSSFKDRWTLATTHFNKTDGVFALQQLVACELQDDGEPGQMILRNAFGGSTTDQLLSVDKKFAYQANFNISAYVLHVHHDYNKYLCEKLLQPFCFQTIKGYLVKRRNQINRKVKPKVRLIQKANSDFGGFRVSCLATGFYPRHINLTLLRDGQPVSDHEVTGGDLLPNGDGTYQMRKSLEIRAEERQKHKYTCSATHLSLDSKLIVTLDFDHNEPFKSMVPSVLAVLTLMLMFGVAAAVWKRWRAASEENVKTKLETDNLMS